MEEIEARLTKLPSGLENLYSAMWSSWGEDERLYRTEAANLLKMALLHQGIYASRLSLFTLVVALEPDLVGTVLTTGKLPTLRRLVVACERMEKRLPVVFASLLEVCFVNTEDRMDGANAEDIPSSLRLLRQNADWSEDQEADWNLLHVMHNRRKVDFVHRSAIDFLRDTVTGRQILRYAALTDLEIYKRALEANFVAYAMRYPSPSMDALINYTLSVQTFDDAHQSSDILQVLHDYTMQVIALPQPPKIITEGDRFLDSEDRTLGYRGFLGLVIHWLPRIGQRNISLSSRWAFNTLKKSDQSYKNYLLAYTLAGPPGAGNRRGDSVEILLQHGADPHSSSKLQRDAPAPQSSWSIALESCLGDDVLEGDTSDTMDIPTAFLNHHADLDEAVVQETYMTHAGDRRWYDVDLKYREQGRYHDPGVTFLRGIKASDVVGFLRNTDDTATPEGKDSDLFKEACWFKSTADALPWRYVAHNWDVGFRLVGGRADLKKVMRRAWPYGVHTERISNDHPNYEDRDALCAALMEMSTPISGEEFLKYLYFRPEQTPDFQQELLATLEAEAQTYKRRRGRKISSRDATSDTGSSDYGDYDGEEAGITD
jgi:hypothetical protein